MKQNVAVMFGGPSVEHDVSIITARQVIKNIDVNKYTVIPLYWTHEGQWLIVEDAHQSVAHMIKRGQSVDFRFQHLVQSGMLGSKTIKIDYAIPTFHGTGGEDGAVQGLLEVLDIPYAGSNVGASAIGMDKALFKDVMRQQQIPVLESIVVDQMSDSEIEKLPFSYPIIVKPLHLGSSIGVQKCDDLAAIKQALAVVFELDTKAMIEPYLHNMIEVNCSVLGSWRECQVSVTEQPLSNEEILTFADKYERGGKAKMADKTGMAGLDRRIPAPISKEQNQQIQGLAKQVFVACGCAGVVRVDFMLAGDGEIYVTEINTIPGSLSFYLWEATGISFRQLIDHLIEIAYKEYQTKHRLIRTYSSEILHSH